MTSIPVETIEPLWEKIVRAADENGYVTLTKNGEPVAIVHIFQKNEQLPNSDIHNS